MPVYCLDSGQVNFESYLWTRPCVFASWLTITLLLHSCSFLYFCLTLLICLHSCSWVVWFDSPCPNPLFGLHIQQMLPPSYFQLRLFCQLPLMRQDQRKREKMCQTRMTNHSPTSGESWSSELSPPKFPGCCHEKKKKGMWEFQPSYFRLCQHVVHAFLNFLPLCNFCIYNTPP